MNSKSQKLYSKMIAAAVATSAVVVPASAFAQDVPVQAEDVTVPVQAEDVTVISGSETQSDYYNATKATESTKDTVTVQPTSGDVTVVNNVGSKKDTVTVKGLTRGDIVKIYSDNKSGLIGKATAKKEEVVIKISKGLPKNLTIYVTKQAKGEKESNATQVKFNAEEVTATPDAGNIRVVNNVGKKKDTITVLGVAAKDVVKVYSKGGEPAKANQIGTAKVKKSGAISVKIRKGFDSLDKVYVSLTNANKHESKLVEVPVTPEPQSEKLKDDQITAKNAIGKKADTVTVTGLTAKDLIKVYASASTSDTTVIGKAKLSKKGDKVVVKIRRGFNDVANEKVYVTVTNLNKAESIRTEVKVSETQQSTTVDTVTVNNKVGVKADTVTVTGVKAKDLIKVYDSPSTADTAKPIGTIKAKRDGEVVVKIKKGFKTGVEKVYVTRTEVGLKESKFVIEKVNETEKAQLVEGNVTVNNQLGLKADTITIKGVSAKDVIKVYDAAPTADTAKVIGTVKAKRAGEVTVKIRKGFKDDIKNVYVTRTSANLDESLPVKKAVGKDAVASTIDAGNIVFTNNVDSADILTVKGLTAKDIIRVYKGESELQKATAKKKGDLVIKLKEQLSTADSVYVTISSKLEAESAKMPVKIEAPSKSDVVNTKDVVLNNNGDKEATLTVVGAKAKSKYTVVDATDGKTEIGTATAKKNGILDIKLNKKYQDLIKNGVKIKVKEYDKEVSELSDVIGKK